VVERSGASEFVFESTPTDQSTMSREGASEYTGSRIVTFATPLGPGTRSSRPSLASDHRRTHHDRLAHAHRPQF
jgi:hypothetical protein